MTDAEWKKTTAAERWTVAVTAHHIASNYEPATHIIKTIAAGQALSHCTRELLDERNAQHAREFAGCTKAETVALHKGGRILLGHIDSHFGSIGKTIGE